MSKRTASTRSCYDDKHLNTQTSNNSYNNKSLSDARTIRDKLIKYDLIRWHRTIFRIDEAIRCVLEHYLMNQKQDLAQRLHQQAYDLLEKYAHRSKYREHYERLAKKHYDALTTLKGNAAPSPSHGMPVSDEQL